ncbi:MAG TPA: cupin domain-containing protein [Bryobacteraceae bacterium]|nr:cupin domain-containing protein [Bryobacteraceae bacterium]
MSTPARQHDQITDELREELALYVFGLLDRDEARGVDRHLKTGCQACSEELRVLAATATELPKALEQIRPDPGLKDRLMARIAAEAPGGFEEPEAGVFVLRGGRGPWRKAPWPGVSYQQLYFDRQTGYATSLLKLEPGAKYPAHHHAGVEQCWVIQGKVRIGSIEIEAGDFEYANAETDHGIVQSDTGCLLLIIASRHDELFV